MIEITTKRERYDLPQVYFMEGVFPGNESFLIGIDPGVNFGITIADKDKLTLLWGRLPKTKEPGMYGRLAYSYTENILYQWYKAGLNGAKAIVEGAAYNKYHGQVGLEEVRFGFYLALIHMGIPAKIVPPATIRKLATGSGKSEAWVEYPQINHNLADSIYMMQAAGKL